MGTLTSKLHRGSAYLAVWPKERQLAAFFPEYRIASATRLGVRVMPALIVLCVLMQFQFGDPRFWPGVVTSILFLASLPMQGLYWLGKRADTPLPPTLVTWYRRLYEQIATAGIAIAEPVARPCYFQLGEALNVAFKQLDKSFIRDL
ncbi:MAG: terminus macrodomain insulation protein YfbV [Oceanisphaera sp.]|uniref:terminus macrodomain insulation protein YfbV n=1 Tax=Oceanisphaera sp. TaxID=1929979 RepID=UPI003F9D11C0